MIFIVFTNWGRCILQIEGQLLLLQNQANFCKLQQLLQIMADLL